MLRSERKFESRELLFSQIAADIAAAKAYFDGEKRMIKQKRIFYDIDGACYAAVCLLL